MSKKDSLEPNFFHDMRAISNYSQISQMELYRDSPRDWILFGSDVRGSTKAIKDGRYKEVNTIGAATIIAAKNACDNRKIPFVFGGDGAFVLVPPEYDGATARSLSFIREKSRHDFKLELRIARIPLMELEAAGAKVKVARFELTPGNSIAMFAGGGLALADRWMKADRSKFLISEELTPVGDSHGLECRWKPLPSSRGGGILTLIICANPSLAEARRANVYEEVVLRIREIVDLKLAQPVKMEKLAIGWTPRAAWDEVRLRRDGLFSQAIGFSKLFFWTIIQAVFVGHFRAKPVKEEVGRYLEQVAINTDSVKLDDQLRMVLDLTNEEKKNLEVLLQEFRATGKIRFGTHYSAEALMTCFVHSSTQHVHFVDGADGGYALAAKMLKEQT